MKISYNWLKEYVENLPSVSDISSSLTMHSFEVESVEKNQEDSLFDIKILPNRSHDCLSHYGIASEIATLFSLNKKNLLPKIDLPKTKKINLKIKTDGCVRGLMVHISGIKVVESPDWLKERLLSIGQKPINSIVDITNYLMYSFGQPMHAFDASKIKKDWRGNYDIYVRNGKEGEKITLLNGTEYSLNSSVVVISDAEKALDIAGIMGGKDSGVSGDTSEIILSISSFDSVWIRKTSSKLKIKTDASQRFENGISSKMPDRVLPYALKLISEISGGEVSGMVEVYPNKEKEIVVETSVQKLSDILGVSLDFEKISEILARQNILCKENEGKISVIPPFERLDINIEEDVAEEIGRIYGYENIIPLSVSSDKISPINRDRYVADVIRKTLVSEGFSEIQTYALVNEGEIEIANPIAGDKGFMRSNLFNGVARSLEQNFKFCDFLGKKGIKIFEIGKIFKKDGEYTHLCIGIKYQKGVKKNIDEEISKMINEIEKNLEISFGDISVVGGMAEIRLDNIIGDVKYPESYSDDFWRLINDKVGFKSVSQYPFATRDVAVFVPSSFDQEELKKIISSKFSDIVVNMYLFDKFEKEGRVSYAYRIVFQSNIKTLTDEEINSVMTDIYNKLKENEGFEIR